MNEQNIEIVDIKIELCREGAVFPRYANPYDAGMDIYAAEDCLIKPGETVPVPTGICLPFLRVRGANKAKKRYFLKNAATNTQFWLHRFRYRGEVMVIMHNLATGSPDKVYTLKDEGNPKEAT